MTPFGSFAYCSGIRRDDLQLFQRSIFPSVHPVKYCDQCGKSLAADLFDDNNSLNTLQESTPPVLREKIISAKARMEAERKPVAILFTDIVDSTAIAERLDPEDWREIVTGAHQLVSQVVYRYEGTIAQLLGDGVLAFFGAPITHEDDPLRAVRAGLEIQAAMQAYQQKVKREAPNFQMRVGVNTGLVVVGNIGDDLHMEYQAIGDAVNLAARLQSLANPGKVVISESIYHVQSQFLECTDQGLVMVKGKSEPVHVYQVDRLREERGDWRANGRAAIQMLGREKETAQLQDLTEAGPRRDRGVGFELATRGLDMASRAACLALVVTPSGALSCPPAQAAASVGLRWRRR